MQIGFGGNAARVYLRAVDEALRDARRAHNKDPFTASSSRVLPHPALEDRVNVTAPHPAGNAAIGRSSVSGVGNSSNVVIDSGEYDSCMGRIVQAENNIASTIYRVVNDINALCDESFSVPLTTDQVRIIAHGANNSWTQISGTTENVDASVRSFVGSILSIS